jgi:hypothetical protein
VSQAIPVPQPWVIELVQRGLQMLIVLLVVALAVLLLVFVACMAYLARSACRCCSKSCAVPELGGSRLDYDYKRLAAVVSIFTPLDYRVVLRLNYP